MSLVLCVNKFTRPHLARRVAIDNPHTHHPLTPTRSRCYEASAAEYGWKELTALGRTDGRNSRVAHPWICRLVPTVPSRRVSPSLRKMHFFLVRPGNSPGQPIDPIGHLTRSTVSGDAEPSSTPRAGSRQHRLLSLNGRRGRHDSDGWERSASEAAWARTKPPPLARASSARTPPAFTEWATQEHTTRGGRERWPCERRRSERGAAWGRRTAG